MFHESFLGHARNVDHCLVFFLPRRQLCSNVQHSTLNTQCSTLALFNGQHLTLRGSFKLGRNLQLTQCSTCLLKIQNIQGSDCIIPPQPQPLSYEIHSNLKNDIKLNKPSMPPSTLQNCLNCLPTSTPHASGTSKHPLPKIHQAIFCFFFTRPINWFPGQCVLNFKFHSQIHALLCCTFVCRY